MRILKRAMPFNPRNAPKCDPNVFNIQVYESYNVARLNARIMKKRKAADGRPRNAVGGLHVQPDSDSNSSEPDGNASESSSLVLLSSSDEENEENEEEADEGQRAEHE